MCGQSVAVSSSISSNDGEPPENVIILSPRGQTTLNTSLQDNIDIDVQYNVTMIAVNEIGASQPSNSVLFFKQPGMYVRVCFIT